MVVQKLHESYIKTAAKVTLKVGRKLHPKVTNSRRKVTFKSYISKVGAKLHKIADESYIQKL